MGEKGSRVFWSTTTCSVVAATALNSNVSPVLLFDVNPGFKDSLSNASAKPETHYPYSAVLVTSAGRRDYILRYTIGKRALRDRIVSQESDWHQWKLPQNVTLLLQYPSTGTGAVVTYIEITVKQTSKIGRAQVFAGGVGHRFVGVLVEANSTYLFNYSSTIYGI